MPGRQGQRIRRNTRIDTAPQIKGTAIAADRRNQETAITLTIIALGPSLLHSELPVRLRFVIANARLITAARPVGQAGGHRAEATAILAEDAAADREAVEVGTAMTVDTATP